MPQYYEIRLKGHLDQTWSDWFDGLTISHEGNGETLLAGMLADQSALHGLLTRVKEMNIPLISVNPLDDASDESEENPE